MEARVDRLVAPPSGLLTMAKGRSQLSIHSSNVRRTLCHEIAAIIVADFRQRRAEKEESHHRQEQFESLKAAVYPASDYIYLH